MPIFEFKCPSCGRDREVIVKTSEIGSLICRCGKAMDRKVSKAGFELKGSGWFKDGYK